MESRTASGLLVTERSHWSSPAAPLVPTVTGADDPPTLTPSRWAGLPADWATPVWAAGWGRVEQLTDTAWMCLDRNASILATMPPYLVGASTSLPVDWLNNPDPLVYGSWFEFAKQLFWDFQLGEAFVMPTAYYANGWPSRFHVVAPWLVSADLAGDGTRRFKIGSVDVTGLIRHIPYQIRADEARGHGPLEAGASRIVAANALARYVGNLAASGGIPHSVLVHPGDLSADQAAELQLSWVNSRMASMGMPAVLSGGIDFKTLSLDPVQMALIDLSRFNEARIAELLGIPGPMVGLPSGQDSLTYNTAVMLREQHWQGGLKPKADPVMQTLSGWALPRGTTIELNRDEYLKPPLLERAQAWEILLRNNVVSIDEVRVAERFSIASHPEALMSGVLE